MVTKEATSVRLTPEAKTLLHVLADRMGLSQAAVLETLIREKAKRDHVTPSLERPRRDPAPPRPVLGSA